MSVFFLGVKDLFFSLEQECLVSVVRERIDKVGAVDCQNEIGNSSVFFSTASGLPSGTNSAL